MTQFEWYIVAAFGAGMVVPLIGMYLMMRSNVKLLRSQGMSDEHVRLNWLTGKTLRMIPSDVICYVNERMGSHASFVVANAFATFDEDTIYHWIYVQYYKAESFADLSDGELQDAVDTLSMFCEVG